MLAARLACALLPGAFAVVALWLGWKSLRWPLVHDAPIMHYIAWRISNGAVPYRDLFDMNFPGVYVFHLAVVRWLGTGDAAWRGVDLGLTAVSALLVGRLAAPWGRTAAFGGASFFAAYHFAAGPWNAGQRDFVLCLFLLAGALGVARWSEQGGRWPLIGSGIALGCGLTIKPHALGFVLPLAGLIALYGRRREPSPLLTVVLFLAASALAPLAVFAWIAHLGALGAWREIVFRYLVPLYSQVARPSDWLYFERDVWTPLLAALALTVARLVWNVRRAGMRHAVVGLGLAYGLLHFIGQRKGWEYHLYPFAAFAAVLLFAEVASLTVSRRWLMSIPLIASLGAVAWLLAVKGANASEAEWIMYKARRAVALGEELRVRTRPGDLVQVLDTAEGGVHALLRAGLVEPTRFLYDFHFYHHVDAPAIVRMRDELLRDLTAHPPALVVLWQHGWPEGGYERLDRFPALREWLMARYRVAHESDGYRIYAKRHDS